MSTFHSCNAQSSAVYQILFAFLCPLSQKSLLLKKWVTCLVLSVNYPTAVWQQKWYKFKNRTWFSKQQLQSAFIFVLTVQKLFGTAEVYSSSGTYWPLPLTHLLHSHRKPSFTARHLDHMIHRSVCSDRCFLPLWLTTTSVNHWTDVNSCFTPKASPTSYQD